MGTRGWTNVAGLLCVSAMTLAACGKDSDTTATTTTASSTTSSTPSSTPSSVTSTTAKAAGELILTADAYGPIKIGMTPAEASATGLIKGDFETGCELGGPGELVGTLAPPLDGTVTSRQGKVEILYVRSRVVTSPGDIRVGDALAKVEASFAAPYTVTVDKSRADMYEAWFVDIAKGDQHVFQMLVDPATQKVTSVGAPFVPLCE